MKHQNKAFWFLVLHGALGLYALSSLCSKLASGQPIGSVKFVAFCAGIFFLLAVYALLWQQIIKHIALSTAYANKAVTVVWGLLLGVLLLGETVSVRQILGALLIIGGIVLFVKSDAEDKNA